MKVYKQIRTTEYISQHTCTRTSKLLRALAMMLAPALSLALSGCVSVRVKAVPKTVLAASVKDATLDELEKKMAGVYAGIQGMQLLVNIAATEGGAHQGEVKELPTFRGIILLRKPADLHVIMQLPIVGSRALDMVSDGKNFKLFIAAGKTRAIVGPEVVTTPSKNGLENLRPNIIRDALQIPPIGPEEWLTLTEDSRLLPLMRGKKEQVEEPDYDLSVLRRGAAGGGEHVLERVRVIHISRVTLLPYQQDLYDERGRIVTTIQYDKYQKFGEIDYPMDIFIKRPLDEYTLRIDITKLVLNPTLDDRQFTLDIPSTVPIQKM